MTPTPDPVRVELSAEWPGGSLVEQMEIDRAEWDAMSPAERARLCEEEAQNVLWNNNVACGYQILGDDEGSDEEADR